MVVEVTIIIKKDDKTYKEKILNYDDTDGTISLSPDCPRLRELIEECEHEFDQEDPDDIIVKTSMRWK